MISACIPIVIIQPSIPNKFRSFMIALISVDLSFTFTCPIDIPIFAKYPLTIYSILPFVHFFIFLFEKQKFYGKIMTRNWGQKNGRK